MSAATFAWPAKPIGKELPTARDYAGDALYDKIISGAQTSNLAVDDAAMRGASFLRYGGRIVLVVGVSISAARIWNASKEELPRVIGEEPGA